MTIEEIEDKQGFKVIEVFNDCWLGQKYDEGFFVAIIDRDGDIIYEKFMGEDREIPANYFSAAASYVL